MIQGIVYGIMKCKYNTTLTYSGLGLIKQKFDADVLPVFQTFKIGNYFSLKCRTPSPLVANAVYKFNCLRDADCSYIGKTERHIVPRESKRPISRKQNCAGETKN